MQIGTFMSLPLNPFIAAAVFGATIRHRRRLCFLHRGGHSATPFSRCELVSAPGICGDQLHRQPGLRRIRRAGFMGRRLSVGNVVEARRTCTGVNSARTAIMPSAIRSLGFANAPA